jgi:SAM-dependent methyltransferase
MCSVVPREMTRKLTFDELVAEALAAPFEGWDFSWLDGRKIDFTLPWDYNAKVRARMRDIGAMLDMGTGGGEILASLVPVPARVCATESYPPNVVIARERLEPLGVDLRDTSGAPDNLCLPFDDAAFDLVINRHESYVPGEVFRILRSGGHFVTQQCGGYGEVDLIEYFKGKIQPMDWTAEVASRQLEEAGFEIIDDQEVYPEYSFLDIGAVVYTLKAIPWLLGDFTVEKYRDRLLAMHEHIQKHGSFTVRDQRFFVEAAKP